MFTVNPPAFMARPGMTPGSWVRLKWSALPLDVYVDGDLTAVQDACEWWNVLVGKRLFLPPMPAMPHVTGAMASATTRPFMGGVILVKTGCEEPFHGDSDLRYNKRSGAMINAVIELPAVTNRPADVARHELGHALGLDHGPEGTLMGAHTPTGTEPLHLAGYQLAALRKMAG